MSDIQIDLGTALIKGLGSSSCCSRPEDQNDENEFESLHIEIKAEAKGVAVILLRLSLSARLKGR